MRARVLVTGAAGRIGSAVVLALVDSGLEVVGLDRRRPYPVVEEAVSSFFIGSGSDREVAGRACRGVRAVVHLGAIASPVGYDPSEVFVNNVSSTFNVLITACEAGARAGVIASSVSALGLVYSPTPFSPIYAPVDENHPLRPCDPYALAKQCDEHTAAMMSRRFGMSSPRTAPPYHVHGPNRHARRGEPVRRSERRPRALGLSRCPRRRRGMPARHQSFPR